MRRFELCQSTRSNRKAVCLAVFLTLTPGAFAEASDEKKPDTPPTKMEAFVVREQSNTSFGFGVDVLKNTQSGKIFALSVRSVKPDSEAEQKGMRPRTRILSIDGRDVEEIDGTFEGGSELFKKFVGRKRGDKVVLEILSAGNENPKTVVLTEK
jgi:C-terminal processing protease CtpA/Prc